MLALVVLGCAAPHHRAARTCWPPRSPWHAVVASTGATTNAAFVPIGRIAPVVAREIAVAPVPGARSLGAMLEPGFPLPATFASWLHVHVDHPVALDGWVPATARGLFFQEARGLAGTTELSAETIVHESPDAAAPVVAVLDAGVSVVISGDPGRWGRIEAIVDRVRVSGWVIVPPPRSVRTFDFGNDVIQGELVRPDASTSTSTTTCAN